MTTPCSARRIRVWAALSWILLFSASAGSAAISSERVSRNSIVRPSASADGLWDRILPSPQARARHAGVYDPTLDRMIVFGGRCFDQCCSDGTVPADTWAYPLETPAPAWIEIRPEGTLPPTGLGAVAIYDPVRSRLLVMQLSNVWALDLPNPQWSVLSVTGTPPSLSCVAAIYDPVRDRMLALSSNGRVWGLTLGGTPDWSELAPTGKVPTQLSSAIYDPARDRVVVFADSVRALTLSEPPSWSVIERNRTTPGYSVIFDPVRDRAIVHGGSAGGDIGTWETWEFTFSGTPQWTLISTAGPVSAYHSAIYDSSNDRMLLFGGYGLQFYVEWTSRELWAMSLDGTPQWTDLTPPSPPRACVHPAVRDEVRERMILVDGAVRALDLAEPPQWSTIAASGTPPPERTDYSAIFDPVRDRLLMYGGMTSGGSNLQDLWSLSLGGAPQWTQPAASGTPPDTARPAVYDPVGDRMLVVGGDHVWALSLAAPMAWTELAPSGTPPVGVFGSSVAYDPAGDRVLVFGGVSASGPRNEVWALDLASGPAWGLLGPSGAAPEPRSRAMMIYDPARDRVVISGGDTGAAAPAGDTWELQLAPSPEWRQLAPEVVAQGGWTAIHDPDRDRMVTVGSCETASDPSCPDPEPYAWALWFNTQVDAPEAPTPPNLSLAQSHPNPARGDLAIRFTVARPGDVTLRVFDVSGRLVRTLTVGAVTAGQHVVRWNRSLDDGTTAGPGVYFYELRATDERLARRMILLR